ncbi:MAG: M28 family peptidase [Eubacteriales bacterium]|nr:M28 family peptidase [Eubacteriales bacterium]MDD3880785.1 M28 family peptidase [Eubacteriales bacterium]MDD4511848.1 M28 family peptidase [Eubacteriales bacterium]
MKNSKPIALILIILMLFGGIIPCAAEGEYTLDVNAPFDALIAAERGAGTIEEAVYADALAARLKSAGLSVRFDGFSVRNNATGAFGSRNVIAVKKTDVMNPDILIVSAHIDSHLCTVGACDDASGAAVLEAVALACAPLSTDTEVWFVFFSGEEERLAGSDAFARSIDEDVKFRIIGDIQLDMLGSVFASGYSVASTNGEATLLSGLLQNSFEKVLNQPLPLITEKMSDHVSLAVAGIPSVMLCQNGDGWENHTVLDDASLIDRAALDGCARAVMDTVLAVMSADTTGLSALERERTKENGIFGSVLPYDECLDFGSSIEYTEAGLATRFTLASSEETEIGENHNIYTAKVRWFGMDTPLTTQADCFGTTVGGIYILPEEQGYTKEQIQAIMTSVMGEPQLSEGGSLTWPWFIGRSFFELTEKDGKCAVSVSNAYNGNLELGRIRLENGEPAGELSALEKKMWDELISKVVRKEERVKFMDGFMLFTEGVHNLTGYTPASSAEKPLITMGLDINDILDNNGNYRNFYKSLATVIHEYGHVLGMNASQTDIANQTDPSLIAGYLPDSYMAAYMTRFYPTVSPTAKFFPTGDYRANPTDYVSTYGAGEPMEDFAESFRCFVLSPEPDTSTVAGKKMAFFYEYPEMTDIRDNIRKNFDLDKYLQNK